MLVLVQRTVTIYWCHTFIARNLHDICILYMYLSFWRSFGTRYFLTLWFVSLLSFVFVQIPLLFHTFHYVRKFSFPNFLYDIPLRQSFVINWNLPRRSMKRTIWQWGLKIALIHLDYKKLKNFCPLDIHSFLVLFRDHPKYHPQYMF